MYRSWTLWHNCPRPRGSQTKTILFVLQITRGYPDFCLGRQQSTTTEQCIFVPAGPSYINSSSYVTAKVGLCVCLCVCTRVHKCPSCVRCNICKSETKCHQVVMNKQQDPACLSLAAKRGPKPTATGETWQCCRLGKGRVLLRLLMIMVVAGFPTDTADLVCTVRGHRPIHAGRERRQHRGGKPLLLTKTERTSENHVTPFFRFSALVADKISK